MRCKSLSILGIGSFLIVMYVSYTAGHKSINNLNRFIKAQKDKTDIISMSNVVHTIDCNDCNVSYVGQTKRQLKTWIKEHRRNVEQDPSMFSVLSKHSVKSNIPTFNWEC